MLNRQCKNSVLVYFPAGAGGKFLMNSLALSNKAVLQSAKLAELDLNNQLTIEDKFNELMTRIQKTNSMIWSDLFLGDSMLFGVENKNFNSPSLAKVIEPLSNSNRLFFSAAHNRMHANRVKEFFPNSTIIQFVNNEEFLKHRPRYANHHQEKDVELIGDIMWDCGVYFDEEKFISELVKLFAYFNISEYRLDLIRIFYKKWKNINLKMT